MRLIDVEEAKQFLKDHLILPEKSYEVIARTMLDAVPTAYEVDKVMEQLEDLKEKKKNGGWIPCSEHLPEESLNSVLGWDEYRQRCCFVQYYGGRWILGNSIESVKITAWQPVPEPDKS